MSGSAVEQSTVEQKKGATRMREGTIRRKKASRSLKGVPGGEWPAGRVAQFLSQGKVIVSSVLNLATEDPNCPRRRCASPPLRASTSH